MGDFGTPFSTGRSGKAGYGTSIQSDDRGRSTKTPGAFEDTGTMRYTSKGWQSDEDIEDEEDDGGGFLRNIEERAIKDEEQRRKKEAREEEKRLREEEDKRAAEEAIKIRGLREVDNGFGGDADDQEAPPTLAPLPGDGVAQEDAAENAPTALSPEKLKARQDAAAMIKAGMRSNDLTMINAAMEDARAAGVADYDIDKFIERETASLSRSGQIQPGSLFGEKSNLDDYYLAQLEKTKGVPLGYRSGKSRPIAPDWRIHTRLYRQVNAPTPREGEVDRRISPEAAAMIYEQKTGRKFAYDRPVEYLEMLRKRREQELKAIEEDTPLPQNLFGFDTRR